MVVVVGEQLSGDFTEGTLFIQVPWIILYYSYCLQRLLEVKNESFIYIYPHFYSHLSLFVCFFPPAFNKKVTNSRNRGNGNLIRFFLSYFPHLSLIVQNRNTNVQ